jgi:hypothetical protein
MGVRFDHVLVENKFGFRLVVEGNNILLLLSSINEPPNRPSSIFISQPLKHTTRRLHHSTLGSFDTICIIFKKKFEFYTSKKIQKKYFFCERKREKLLEYS